MSAPDIDASLMDHFAGLVGDTHLTFLLGAGVSAPSGLPTWDEFAERLALSTGLVNTLTAAKTLVAKQDPTIVLEAARSRAGAEWNAYLHSALFGDTGAIPDPAPLHLAVAAHYLAAQDRTTLATLNFDTLLESAIEGEGVPVVLADAWGQNYAKLPTVHHLHGIITGGSAYAPVVGYRDFAELVAGSDTWQREFLSSALGRGPLLLAGTSYRDPDIRHWIHQILANETPAHRTLVTIVREGLGLDLRTFDSIKDGLAAEWSSIGLTALPMQDLADVATVVRELRHAHAPGYATPNERAKHLWKSHNRRFAELQIRYSAQLRVDAEQAQRALGVRCFRGTLWLANGRGKLARWSTEDTRFTEPKRLKLVPSGHDSPWIAGEAIASEEVKLKDVQRENRVTPTWKSVLALPIHAGNGELPDIACAVLTFGVSTTAARLLDREEAIAGMAENLTTAWNMRLSDVAFPGPTG